MQYDSIIVQISADGCFSIVFWHCVGGMASLLGPAYIRTFMISGELWSVYVVLTVVCLLFIRDE